MVILEEPRVIRQDMQMDERGFLSAMELPDAAQRVYTVRNHKRETIRAWHGHPREWRLVKALKGAARVNLLDLSDFHNDRGYTISHDWLYVPRGWAIGWMDIVQPNEMLFVAPSHYADRDDVLLDRSLRADLWKAWQKFTPEEEQQIAKAA